MCFPARYVYTTEKKRNTERITSAILQWQRPWIGSVSGFLTRLMSLYLYTSSRLIFSYQCHFRISFNLLQICYTRCSCCMHDERLRFPFHFTHFSKWKIEKIVVVEIKRFVFFWKKLSKRIQFCQDLSQGGFEYGFFLWKRENFQAICLDYFCRKSILRKSIKSATPLLMRFKAKLFNKIADHIYFFFMFLVLHRYFRCLSSFYIFIFIFFFQTNDKRAESRVITVIFHPKNCHLTKWHLAEAEKNPKRYKFILAHHW